MATGMSSSSSSAAAAAAPSSSSSSKNKSNFPRLCWLLIDTGTQVLREVFDNIHQPTSLYAVLHSTSEHDTLRQLKSRRILKTQQWSKLYPSRSTSVSSASFDGTLLFALLRNICGLTPASRGWDKPPAASDLSKEADLARIEWYRKEVYAHRTDTAVSDADFEKLWTEISAVLIRLGGPHYKPDIDRLKEESMDIDDEKYFIKALEEWEDVVPCDCKGEKKCAHAGGTGVCTCRKARKSCSDQCKCTPKECSNRKTEEEADRRPPVRVVEPVHEEQFHQSIQASKEEIQTIVASLSDEIKNYLLVNLLTTGKGSLDFARSLVDSEENPPPNN